MAEAEVQDLRFYCHLCNKRFHSASSSFTCPFCSNGFIEEVPNQAVTGDEEGSDNDDWPSNMREFLVPSVPIGDETWGRRGRPRQTHRLAATNFNIENFIHDVIINLGVGVNWGNAGNMQLFLGNPGDYAWGREGLDAIITQLLNQMDSTGPPPLSKQVIDSLPIVQIEEEQVKKKLQCSVCWEDFKLQEDVRQLPCSHVYHENCIRPWLELHGTCPICRQYLGRNEQSIGVPDAEAGEGATVVDMTNEVFGSVNFRNESSSSSSSDNSSRYSRD